MRLGAMPRHISGGLWLGNPGSEHRLLALVEPQKRSMAVFDRTHHRRQLPDTVNSILD